MAFVARGLLNKTCTIKVVQVVAVNSTGETVDVNILVNQVDGSGKSTPHGIIHGLSYWRYQGGSSAAIIDPVINDIGIILVADRDISIVKTTKAQANPGSFREFDVADGIYLGGILNSTPTTFVKIGPSGITMTTPNTITLNASGNTWTFGPAGLTMATGIVAETHQHNYLPGGGASTTTSTPVV